MRRSNWITMRLSEDKLVEIATPLVDALLFEEWDPIGINNRPCRDEYTNYSQRAALLAVENNPTKLGDYLHTLAVTDMGDAGRSRELDLLVARRITDAVQRLVQIANNPKGYAMLKSLTSFAKQASRQSHLIGLSIFGSVARAMQRPDSDIDLLVRFPSDHEPTLLELAHLANEAEDLLGRKADLVLDGDHLRPSFRRRIEKDCIRVA